MRKEVCMGLKIWLVIFLVCLFVFGVIFTKDTTMGYYTDTESSLDNILRIAESW